MLSQSQHSHERRSQSHDLIRDLIKTRTEMLALYSKLAAKKPFSETDEDVPDLLQEFCEILIDYTASAHFRLYRYIDERAEKRRRVMQVAEGIYPRIAAITQFIVDFNDRYETKQSVTESNHLEQDLSRLGEELAERIELEDRLIEVLIEMRAPKVQQA